MPHGRGLICQSSGSVPNRSVAAAARVTTLRIGKTNSTDEAANAWSHRADAGRGTERDRENAYREQNRIRHDKVSGC